MAKLASQNKKVQSIRKALLKELETNKIFVSWKDRDARMVNMIIEGDQTIKMDRFKDIVGDKLPHDIFDYSKHPSNKLVDWAETHILFHV